jgi:hypothetical protein
LAPSTDNVGQDVELQPGFPCRLGNANFDGELTSMIAITKCFVFS